MKMKKFIAALTSLSVFASSAVMLTAAADGVTEEPDITLDEIYEETELPFDMPTEPEETVELFGFDDGFAELLDVTEDDLIQEGNTFKVKTGAGFLEAVSRINSADSGEYFIELMNDIDLNSTASFTNNTATIIGNDHTLYANSELVFSGGTLNLGKAEGNNTRLTISGEKKQNSGESIFNSGNDGVLNMYDNTYVGSLNSSVGAIMVYNATFNMYGGEISGVTSTYGAVAISGVEIGSGASHGEMNMYGGKITGNNNYGYVGGGGVLVWGTENFVFNMYGGEISGNKATNGRGGGVYVNDRAVFNMSGGKISGNTAPLYYGGGVMLYTNTKFNMSGGEISGNTAGSYGGGVMSMTPDCVMSGGEISGNTGKYGGGICVYGQNFTMTGGKISDNTATAYGGGITTFSENSTAVITDGEISGNTAIYGGGIFLYTGEVYLGGGSINNNSSLGSGGGVYINGAKNLYISGAVNITGNTGRGTAADNLFIWDSEAFVNVVGDLSGSSIGITDGNETGGPISKGYSTYNYADPSMYFFSDKEGNYAGYTINREEVRIREDRVAKDIGVVFEPVEGKPYEYIIKLKSLTTGGFINRFMSTDLAFENSNSRINYEITPPEGVDIGITEYDSEKTGTREFHFEMNGNGESDMTGTELTIGKITFEGYGHLDFSVDKDYSSSHAVNVVNTAVEYTNIVYTYDLSGKLVVNTDVDTGFADFLTGGQSGVISADYAVGTKKLTVNIEFPNHVDDNTAAYQDMTMTISGGDLAQSKVIPLGTDAAYTGINTDDLEKAYYTEAGGRPACYTVELDNELTENIAYTVTLEGAGYRTAHYTVLMNDDKELTFWNNVATIAKVIETGSAKAGVVKNFLAGDIVKDNNINIYDLSAVISYFGSSNDRASSWEYAKYDLNRDGVIDSKDIAYVLVSWEN